MSKDPIGLGRNNPNLYVYFFDSNTEVARSGWKIVGYLVKKWKGVHIEMICRIAFLQLGLAINGMLLLIIEIPNLE